MKNRRNKQIKHVSHRRVAACLAACDGVSTRELEKHLGDEKQPYRAALDYSGRITTQRNALLTAVSELLEMVGGRLEQYRALLATIEAGKTPNSKQG